MGRSLAVRKRESKKYLWGVWVCGGAFEWKGGGGGGWVVDERRGKGGCAGRRWWWIGEREVALVF